MSPAGGMPALALAAVGVAAGAAAGAALITLRAFRPSDLERRRAMSGDAIVSDSRLTITQAVTIEAPPEQVWPWLAQMGGGRAGWYSYDHIDNAGRASAWAVDPDLQHLTPGDLLPGLPGAEDGFVAHTVRPPYQLVLTAPVGEPVMSWQFQLEPRPRRQTRLIVRVGVSARWQELAAGAPSRAENDSALIERVYGLLSRLPAALQLRAMGLGHRIMQNQQLRGIRKRAEQCKSLEPAHRSDGYEIVGR